MSIWTNAPEVRCPECTVRFDHGAHWELQLEHVLECPACGTRIVLCNEEALRRWSWRKALPHKSVDTKEK